MNTFFFIQLIGSLAQKTKALKSTRPLNYVIVAPSHSSSSLRVEMDRGDFYDNSHVSTFG